MIWQLLSVSDWRIIMIGPGGSRPCCYPSFSFMGGVARKQITKLGCKKIIVQGCILSTAGDVLSWFWIWWTWGWWSLLWWGVLSLPHSLLDTSAIFFSIFELWKSVGLCQTWWPIELKFEKEGRQAGRQFLTYSCFPPTTNFGRNQPRNNRRRKLEIFQILGYVLLRMLRSLVVGVSVYQFDFLKELWQFSNSFKFWMKPSLVQLSDEPFFWISQTS